MPAHGLGRTGPQAPVTGGDAVCASQHPLVTDAMLATMARGGNAFDAAVTGCLVSATVQQEMTNHGGSVTMLCWDAASGSTVELSSFGTLVTGMGLFRPIPFGPAGDHLNLPGPCALIPGFMPGLKAIHERFASRPWAELCEPAIRHAEEGHEVGSFEHMVLTRASDFALRTPSGRAHFTIAGRAPQVGDRWVKPELARTLRRLAVEGPDDFVTGRWARDFVRRANEIGWPIELAHMSAIPPRWGTGVRYRHPRRGVELVQMGAPERQAIVSGLVLGVLDALDVRSLGHWSESAESLYYTAHVLRRAIAETDLLHDPAIFEDPTEVLASGDYHERIAELLRRSRPRIDLTEHVRLVAGPHAAHGTLDERHAGSAGSCELSAVDGGGNWVQILNTYQGGGLPGEVVGGVPMVGGTLGTTMSAMFNGWLTGGGRMRSIVGHTIVLRDGQPVLALGTPGLPHVTVPQVLSSILDHGYEPWRADDSPRMMPLSDDYGLLVEDGLDPGVPAAMARKGVVVTPLQRYDYRMGSFQMSWRDDAGLHAAAGPRRAGTAAAS